MLEVAYIFPGQGAQYVSMGSDLYQRYPQAREVITQAAELLQFDLARLMFSAGPDELTQTSNCQVTVFVLSIACLRCLESVQPRITVKYTAGLSLGEYAALVAAGALEFSAAVKLVRQRAQLMDEAGQQNPGGMVSIIGLPLDAVEQICARCQTEVANLNCPGQIVVSGRLSALKRLETEAKSLGAKKVIPLQVSGAFHSSLMAPATAKLTQALEQVTVQTPRIPVISNVTAAPQRSPEEIRHNLAQQLVKRTLWQDSVRLMSSAGINNFIELGPGRVLKGLLRKIDPGLSVRNIGTVEELEEYKQEQIPCS